LDWIVFKFYECLAEFEASILGAARLPPESSCKPVESKSNLPRQKEVVNLAPDGRLLNRSMRAIPSMEALPGRNYSWVISSRKSHVRLLLGPMEPSE
jgi:hypothetical protein